MDKEAIYNKYLMYFIDEVYASLQISGLSIDEDYNLLYIYDDHRLIITREKLQQYYNAYSYSQQTRVDAIQRTGAYISKVITQHREA